MQHKLKMASSSNADQGFNNAMSGQTSSSSFDDAKANQARFDRLWLLDPA